MFAIAFRSPTGSDAHLQSSTLATCNPFNALPPRSNDSQKVIDTHCTFVLFFLVYLHTELRSAESHSRCFEHPAKDAHPELSSGTEGVFCAARPPQFLTLASVPLSHGSPRPITLLPCTHNPFRINTYKSLSKQTTLTLIESHSYKKHRGRGVLWLTSHGT